MTLEEKLSLIHSDPYDPDSPTLTVFRVITAQDKAAMGATAYGVVQEPSERDVVTYMGEHAQVEIPVFVRLYKAFSADHDTDVSGFHALYDEVRSLRGVTSLSHHREVFSWALSPTRIPPQKTDDDEGLTALVEFRARFHR